jgi:hypothetical protein
VAALDKAQGTGAPVLRYSGAALGPLREPAPEYRIGSSKEPIPEPVHRSPVPAGAVQTPVGEREDALSAPAPLDTSP